MASLSFSKDHQLILETENWNPGDYANRTVVVSRSSWSWSCKNNTITISNGSEEHSAIIITIGENPLQLPGSTQALSFESTDNASWAVLSSEIFYKQ